MYQINYCGNGIFSLQTKNFAATHMVSSFIPLHVAAVSRGVQDLDLNLLRLLKTMANIVKGTFIVNHEDDRATEIDKFVVVLELNHASLFGDATYKINLSRQTKMRRPDRCAERCMD